MNFDNQEFEKIVNDHQKMVVAIAFQILGDRDLAQDMAQDIFVKIYFALRKFDGRSKLSTWIYRITYNHVISAKRKQKEVAFDNFEAMGLVDCEYDADRERQLQLVGKIVGELKTSDRMIIIFYYYQQMGIEEIAQITNQSESNIKVRLHRLRKKISQEFNDQNI